MANDIMIDLETLDVRPQCVILTIGVVRFDPYGSGVAEKFTLKPTIEDQTELYNRTINDETMAWWAQQTPEAQAEAFSEQDRIPLRDCMEIIYKICWNRRAIWSHGAPFDVVICEDAMRQTLTDRPNPIAWPFYVIRDTRTLFEIAGVSLKDGGHVTSHTAADDAERQAVVVQQAYRKLGLKKK